MLDDEKIVVVTNRKNNNVGYLIRELGVRRQFAPKESKKIKMSELRALGYIPGGKYIIQNCLIVREPEAVEEVIGSVEPEYFYTQEQIDDILLNGSRDAFEDCLNFAPVGVLDLLKERAVALELNDFWKREMILKKLEFNVSKAVEINRITAEEDEKKPEGMQRIRKAEQSEQKVNNDAPVRKAAAPKYKL